MKYFIPKMPLILVLLLALITSCTQKYRTYHVIKKSQFNYNEEHVPIFPKLRKGKKEIQKLCEGQILFNKNAQKINEANIPAMIQYSCPGKEYLLDAKFTETWWTTIIYSQSCIKLESYCPQ